MLVHFFKDVVDCVAKQRARSLFFFPFCSDFFDYNDMCNNSEQ